LETRWAQAKIRASFNFPNQPDHLVKLEKPVSSLQFCLLVFVAEQLM